jgi:hypothetical protein
VRTSAAVGDGFEGLAEDVGERVSGGDGAAAFSAFSFTSSCADPRCSIWRDPRREDHTLHRSRRWDGQSPAAYHLLDASSSSK